MSEVKKKKPAGKPKGKAKGKPKKKLDNALAGDIKKKKKLRKVKKDDDEKTDGPRPKKFPDTPEGKKQATVFFGKIVAKRGYKDQLVFFMNAMWAEHCGDQKARETMYTWMCKFDELGENAKKSKHDLDDFQAARFLESFGKTMTVIERRKELREIDIDENNRMGMLEWLVYNYKCDIVKLMNKPQGTNAALKAAAKALKVVMTEIGKIEKEKARFNKLIKDGKGLAAIRAKAELAQLLDKDPLPVNKALITAEAAVRKAEKSKDISAMGRRWMMKYELEQAKAYKPKGGIKKGRFSVSS